MRPSAEPTAARTRRRLALATLAVLVTAADTYVVVLALPEVMAGVGLGLADLSRAAPIISGFLIGYVSVLPLVGRLSDLHGRVPVLVGSLLVFTAGSVLTATAESLGPLVLGRTLQGVGGGGLVPVTLALVADGWPPRRRGVPLGIVGASQELGAVVGPLLGALVLAVTSWRGIFWGAAAAGLSLALALRLTGPRRRPTFWAALTVTAALSATMLLARPPVLADTVSVGAAWVPLLGGTGRWSSPLGLATLGLAAATVSRWLARHRPTLAGVRSGLSAVDAAGAVLLSATLALVVAAFASADPERQVLGDSGPLLLALATAAAVLLVLRERTARHPLLDPREVAAPAAWGSLLVSLLLGVALMAVLVDVPIFARATRFPDDQTGAALVLLRFLVAVPVGALLGGALLGRVGTRWPAVAGCTLTTAGLVAMTRWDPTALDGAAPAATAALLVAGLGLGLAISPVNAAVLAVVRPALHGTASAMVVVARMIGMLVGLSLLTAVGLRVFAQRQASIGSPLELCPTSPGSCPAYSDAVQAAVLGELHVIFAGAAGCAALAAVLAVLLLRTDAHRDPAPVSSPDEPVPASSPGGA